MAKQSLVWNQQFRFMLLNLLSFTIIFTLFGIIIFSQVRSTLFEKTDRELLSFREMVEDGIGKPEDGGRPPMRDEPDGNRPNPRIIEIRWSGEGRILNPEQLGTQLSDSVFASYKPDFSKLDIISDITVSGDYDFRSVLFQEGADSTRGHYTQLLINTDAEQTILENFGKLLVLCSTVFIVLSFTASYLLSKRMMKPIIRSWKRQTEFVENASHELRTPLTVIQNKLELLLRSPKQTIADKFEPIALSLSETRRLSKLTADLLTLARADSSETQLEKKQISLDDFIRSVSIPYAEIAESQDKIFRLELVGNPRIQADEVRLHQLLVILLDNSLKYTSEGDLIEVRMKEVGQTVTLEVVDTGIGIHPENVKRVFNRFFREDEARSRETGGSGMGLAIAEWIVHAHGGSIQALVNQEDGTTIAITLPKKLTTAAR